MLHPPRIFPYGLTAVTDHDKVSFSINAIPADLHYLSTMNMQLIAGSDFTNAGLPTNTTGGDTTKPAYRYILNETAVRKIGWPPEQAIGKIVLSRGRRRGDPAGLWYDQLSCVTRRGHESGEKFENGVGLFPRGQPIRDHRRYLRSQQLDALEDLVVRKLLAFDDLPQETALPEDPLLIDDLLGYLVRTAHQ